MTLFGTVSNIKPIARLTPELQFKKQEIDATKRESSDFHFLNLSSAFQHKF